MHIVLGILGAIVSILYLLDHLGINLGGLNPFYWRRRRAWSTRYESDPIYSVENPKEVAAILVVGAAKIDGDLSAGQKDVILRRFEANFSLSSREASQLLGSAAHLFGAPQVVDNQLNGVATENRDLFSDEQAASMIEMIVDVISADGGPSASQSEYLENIKSLFQPAEKSAGTWA